MPYKNINFIKLKMELLEDDRFLFDLNDTQKGLFIMLLALAGKTINSIRNNQDFIKTRLGLKELDMKDVQRISQVFPKFSLNGDYWSFENFDKSHNFIQPFSKELQRNSQGTPKDFQRKDKNKKENKKENREIELRGSSRFAPPTPEQLSEAFKTSPLDADRFYSYYQSNGWRVGRNPMKDWRAAARNWLSRDGFNGKKKLTSQQRLEQEAMAIAEEVKNL